MNNKRIFSNDDARKIILKNNENFDTIDSWSSYQGKGLTKTTEVVKEKITGAFLMTSYVSGTKCSGGMCRDIAPFDVDNPEFIPVAPQNVTTIKWIPIADDCHEEAKALIQMLAKLERPNMTEEDRGELDAIAAKLVFQLWQSVKAAGFNLGEYIIYLVDRFGSAIRPFVSEFLLYHPEAPDGFETVRNLFLPEEIDDQYLLHDDEPEDEYKYNQSDYADPRLVEEVLAWVKSLIPHANSGCTLAALGEVWCSLEYLEEELPQINVGITISQEGGDKYFSEGHYYECRVHGEGITLDYLFKTYSKEFGGDHHIEDYTGSPDSWFERVEAVIASKNFRISASRDHLG